MRKPEKPALIIVDSDTDDKESTKQIQWPGIKEEAETTEHEAESTSGPSSTT